MSTPDSENLPRQRMTSPRSKFIWGNGHGTILSRKCCPPGPRLKHFPIVEGNKKSGAVFYFERPSFKKCMRRIEFKWDDIPDFADVAENIHIGSMVKGNYLGRGMFVPGVISAIRKDGTYDIDYDDFELEKGSHMTPDMITPLGVVITIYDKTAFSERVTTYRGVQELIKDWDKVRRKKKKTTTVHFKLCAKLTDGQIVPIFNIRQPKHIPANTHSFLNELMAHVPVNDMYRKNYPCFADFATHTPPRDYMEEDGWWASLAGMVEELLDPDDIDAPQRSEQPVPEEEDFMFMKLEAQTYEGMR